MEKTRLNANIPVKLKKWLEKYAEKNDMTQTEVVIQSLYYVKKGEDLEMTPHQMRILVNTFSEVLQIPEDYFVYSKGEEEK